MVGATASWPGAAAGDSKTQLQVPQQRMLQLGSPRQHDAGGPNAAVAVVVAAAAPPLLLMPPRLIHHDGVGYNQCRSSC
jgi:hypothetical protein